MSFIQTQVYEFVFDFVDNGVADPLVRFIVEPLVAYLIVYVFVPQMVMSPEHDLLLVDLVGHLFI